MAQARKRPITNDEIHEELKKLHLAVQTLTATVAKVHEEHKQTPLPVRRFWNLGHGKQSWWS